MNAACLGVIDSKLMHGRAEGPGNAVILTNGTVSNQQFTNLPMITDTTLINNIIDNPAGYYFNAHSEANPNGAVRGQLVRE